MDETRIINAEEISKANTDLGERMSSEGLWLSYNEEADVLSIIIGKPVPAITEPLLDDIMYRIDPDTFKIVGVEIVCFSTDFVKKNKIIRKIMKDYLSRLLRGEKIEIIETSKKKKFGEALEVLTYN